jgi:DNA-directed RNA polymerase subunit H
MDFSLVDKIYRSRINLLDILDSRGYDTTPYRKFSPQEIERMAVKPMSLMMDLKVRSDADTPVEGVEQQKTIRVIYFLERLKQRLPKLMNRLLADDEDILINPEKTEVIVMTNDEIGDVFNNEAIKAYNKYYQNVSLKISFFEILHLSALNPLNHVRVPKHEAVPHEEHDALMKKLFITNKNQLPIIRYHEDAIARCMGLVPGDIVKITRPSPTAGEYIPYRVCTP